MTPSERDRIWRACRPRHRRIHRDDLPSLTDRWVGDPVPCHHCEATGLITRERYPWSRMWASVPTPALDYPCDMCRGTGVYTPRAMPQPIDLDKSKIVLFGRWRDPLTGVVHGRRMDTGSKSRAAKKGLFRPSCGNGGMAATIRRREFDYTQAITCPDCLVVYERRMLVASGVAPLVPREPGSPDDEIMRVG